jgi:hypothetical protein
MVTAKRFEWSKIRVELRKLHKLYESASEGYRSSTYDLLQQSAYRAVHLRKDPKLECEMAKDSKGTKDPIAVVCAFLVGGEASSRQKQASKFAIVLRYLLDKKKIKPAKIAKALKSFGGIEKIARKAAKRRNKSHDPLPGHGHRAKAEKTNADRDAGDRSVDWSAVALEGSGKFLEKIASAKPNQIIKILTRRPQQGNSLRLNVQRVIIVDSTEKETPAKSVVESDW